jgi:transposase-like protein
MEMAQGRYSRELKVAAMRELDAGRRIGEVARAMELSPKLLERWRGEWLARGERAFPGSGRRGEQAVGDPRRMAELERKIGQLTMENDFLKKALQHFREQARPAVVGGDAACSNRSARSDLPAKANGGKR